MIARIDPIEQQYQLGFYIRFQRHALTIPRSSGDFLNVWGKHLLLVLVLIQIVLAALAVPVLRGESVGTRRRMVLGAATLVDLLALTVLLWIIPNQAPMTVTASLPDYWTLTLAIGAGVIWGVIRTVLLTKQGRTRQTADA